METEYKFKLENSDEGIRLTNYQDDNGYFKSTTPISKQDKKVVENLKGLIKALNLNELNIQIKIK